MVQMVSGGCLRGAVGFELDLLSKGIASDGSPHSLSEDRSELALVAWLGEHIQKSVGRVGGDTRPTGSG